MSQSHNAKKGSKKEPAKTMKEKQTAKRDKKNSKNEHAFINNITK